MHVGCGCGFEQECRQFLSADYRNPKCPSCGKRPFFFGEMARKYSGFVRYDEKKHVPALKRAYRPKAYLEETLAAPMAYDPYWCLECGEKRLKFTYDGFW